MKPWQKWAITIAGIITFPIWIIPAGIAVMVWGIHDSIWNKP